MAINITLISDWGNNNPYLSIFMGELLKNDILHNVIVISNDIAPNDFIDANYLFNATWHHFPNDTIHLITINSNISPDNGFLYINGFNHHFIAPNNGILYYYIHKYFNKLSIYKITNDNIKYQSFYELDYFIFAISNIYQKKSLQQWTKIITDEKEIIPYLFPMPSINNGIVIGEVIHIDNFGNIITNITNDFFQINLMDHKWQMSIRHYKIYKLSKGYIDVNEQNIFAFFNSQDLLELGIKGFNASELLGVKKGEKIYIKIIN
ncbi:MAG: SAM-dependent chlorinase/fluorinase [Bacteroidales bacterium]|jgi:S-adenosylmethionine hydrolase|nr:SAM-dependent chlorinase/fluorinase [Bacteroidales bacterium]HOB78173.1 SAM-dependent chlorinase/fluorinase [Bacteroidales bacterium]HPZ60863.1 SAM-dependent chlorinase/fluorinase [Bacteroidales bacterium]HQD59113.1 SAM-dependent chlorinase/fluorinase [Bacteroidales bacterium]